jgi:hypothetical protein
MKRLVLGISLLALAVLVGMPSLAHADTITISLQEAGVNSGNPTVEATSSTGVAAIAGLSYGTFTVNTVTGTGSPAVNEPELDSTSTNVNSSASGTLTVYVMESGITSPTGTNSYLSSFTSNVLNGAISGVTEATLINGAPLAAGVTFHSIGASASTNSATTTAPFSETEVYTITATGAGNVNDTIDITAAPEPGSLGLLSSGLFGIALLGLRRRKLVA